MLGEQSCGCDPSGTECAVEKLGLGVPPGDEIHLRPDRDVADRWTLKRGLQAIGCLQLSPSASPVVSVGEWSGTLDPVDRRSLALWRSETAIVEAWFERSRRPWRAWVVLPGDEELPLVRGPIRSPRLRCRVGSVLATFDTTTARDDRPQAHARIGKHAALAPQHASAVLLVLTVVLLDELNWMPVEDRSTGDMGWEQRAGMLDGLFGGGGGGGGDGGGGS